jgi:hypothetical protein
LWHSFNLDWTNRFEVGFLVEQFPLVTLPFSFPKQGCALPRKAVSFVAPRHRAFGAKTEPLLFSKHALNQALITGSSFHKMEKCEGHHPHCPLHPGKIIRATRGGSARGSTERLN